MGWRSTDMCMLASTIFWGMPDIILGGLKKKKSYRSFDFYSSDPLLDDPPFQREGMFTG